MKVKKYFVFIKTEWQRLLEYRGDILVYTLSGAIVPLVSLAIWLSVINSGGNIGLTRSDTIIYFLLVAWISLFTSSWGAYFVAENILEGKIVKNLIKPLSILEEFVANNVSEKIYKLLIMTALLLLIAIILFKNTSISTNISLVSVVLFLFSICMAAVIAFLLDLSIGLVTFWTHDIDFLRQLFVLGREFFSGKVIPIFLLPGLLSGISIFIPFRYIISFPIEVLLNRLTLLDLILGFTVQFLWFFCALLLYRLLYAKGTKLYQGYGV